MAEKRVVIVTLTLETDVSLTRLRSSRNWSEIFRLADARAEEYGADSFGLPAVRDVGVTQDWLPKPVSVRDPADSVAPGARRGR